MPDLTHLRQQIAGLACPYIPEMGDDTESIEQLEALCNGWNLHARAVLAIIDAAKGDEGKPRAKLFGESDVAFQLTVKGQRDKFYGRPDKPFHKPECCCAECLEWIQDHPI